MSLRKSSIGSFSPFNSSDAKGNALDFGILYDAKGEATDEIFVTAKRPNGEEITVTFTIEDSFEIETAIKHCAQVAILARHGTFTRPTNHESLSKKIFETKVRES